MDDPADDPIPIEIDVRGQTCPGYLLSIHRRMAAVPAGARVLLRISYPPCADDVRVWCEANGHTLESVRVEDGEWCITVRRGARDAE